MHGAVPWSENARLRAESQRLRVEAIRVRIGAVHAFCSVVECEARWESRQKAQNSMGKVWHVVAELKRHLTEPEHIPAESVGELRELLAALEDRALRIHRALQDAAPNPGTNRPKHLRTRPGN